MSVSSNRAVLNASAQHVLSRDLPLDLDWVTKEALRRERSTANGHAIAGQDVLSIVRGGVVEVHTKASGVIFHEAIAFDRSWMHRHFTYGYDPMGERHDVPDLLNDLFEHPKAKDFVTEISQYARCASAAVADCDIEDLAFAIRKYVEILDNWMRGRLISQPVRKMVDQLKNAMGRGLRAWKPLGAGAASSIVLGHDSDDQETAIQVMRGQGWIAVPVKVADGLQCKVENGRSVVRIEAPHRLDFCGGADLGMDPAIGVSGVCCSMAVEPKSELRLELRR